MKVLHLINSLSRGGAESLLKDLLILMKKNGVQVDILTLTSWQNELGEELQKEEISIFSTGLNSIYSPKQVLRIIPFLKSYDLVHVHLFPAQYWYCLAAKLTKASITALTTEHSTWNRRRNWFLFKHFDSLVYQQYAKIICVSEEVQKNICFWIPNLKEKTITIKNGIVIDRYALAEPCPIEQLASGLSKNDKLILMAARMSSAKDQETLIRAIKLLPPNYRLLLAGEGERKEVLVNFVREMGLADRVHFLGFRADLASVLKSVDLFVLSSHWEGFGLAAVEAMASGLPVLGSNVGGLAQTLGRAGVVFPRGDYESLAGMIRRFLTDRKYYESKSVESRERAKSFSIEQTASEYLKIYAELLK